MPRPGRFRVQLPGSLLYFGVVEQKQKSWLASANAGLAILAFINLFSYLDRYVVAGVLESLKHSDLGLSDANLGSLMSGFLLVYTLLAPVFGALGDRRSRPRLDRTWRGLLEFRDCVVGLCRQLSHAVRSTRRGGRRRSGLRHHRAQLVVGLFSSAPARPGHGDFLLRHSGRIRSGLRRRRSGRQALRLAFGILCRGRSRPGAGGAVSDAARPAARHPRSGSRPVAAPAAESHRRFARASAARRWTTYGRLLRNKPYALTVLGYAAYTFAMGGLAYWMPAFLSARAASRAAKPR